MIKKVEIFDLDGCVIDSSHRYATILRDGKEYIDLAFWIAHQNKVMQDKLLPLATYYKKCLNNPEVYVIVATARVMSELDYKFLDEILGRPDYLISRALGDNQSGTTLKIDGLKQLKNLKPFRAAKWRMYEDNISYLAGICNYFGFAGVYVPSNQGH